MEVNLTPTKLFSADSPLQEVREKQKGQNSPTLQMGRLRDDYIIPYYFLATVLVRNPGDLSDPEQLQTLADEVEKTERPILSDWKR